MKISKIPGCGSFGVIIDDVDFNHLTDEEWMEIGRIHLKEMVTIIRNTKLDKISYFNWMQKWGRDRLTYEGMLHKKYPQWDGRWESFFGQQDQWDVSDAKSVYGYLNVLEHDLLDKGKLIRVCGGFNDQGSPKGLFADGELLWHSNESGNIAFAPGVALLGYENTTKSATGFLTTVDYYNDVSDSFRSELDDMILIHNFTEGRINPGLNNEQDNLLYKNMAPDINAEIPMVIRSPYGHKGLHFSFNTVTGIKGMSSKESDSLLNKIKKELDVDKYRYDHWYQEEGDLCLFDNSITQHRRLGETKDRLCYRYQYDYTNLQSDPWMPYLKQPYIDKYIDRITFVVNALNTKDFKLPKRIDYETI